MGLTKEVRLYKRVITQATRRAYEMKLWAVTNGEFYDDYRVIAICTTEEKAIEIKKKFDGEGVFASVGNVIPIESDTIEIDL